MNLYRKALTHKQFEPQKLKADKPIFLYFYILLVQENTLNDEFKEYTNKIYSISNEKIDEVIAEHDLIPIKSQFPVLVKINGKKITDFSDFENFYDGV